MGNVDDALSSPEYTQGDIGDQALGTDYQLPDRGRTLAESPAPDDMIHELLNELDMQKAPLEGGSILGLATTFDTDSDHDVQIGIGVCVSDNKYSSYYRAMRLTAALTKQIDATWTAGDNAGGMFTGSVAAFTRYYLFLIRNDTTFAIDAGWDTSDTAANKPAGYTAYKKLREYRTDVDSNLIDDSLLGSELALPIRVQSEDNTNLVACLPKGVPNGARFFASFRGNMSFYGEGTIDVTRSTIATMVNQHGVLVDVAVDEERATSEGLLIEVGTTNEFLYSNDFSDANWVKTRCSISADAVAGPDGLTTMDELIEDGSASTSHYVDQNPATGPGDNVICGVSFHLKANTRTQVRILLVDKAANNTISAYFDLANGVVLSEQGGIIESYIEGPFADGTYRCGVIGDVLSGGSTVVGRVFLAVGGSQTYSGDGTSSIYVGKAQFESIPNITSYMESVAGTAVSRSADSYVADILNIGLQSRPGVIAGTFRVMSINNTSKNIMSVTGETGRTLRAETNNNDVRGVWGDTTVNATNEVQDDKRTHRCAVRHLGNGVIDLWLDGVLQQTATGSDVSDAIGTVLNIGMAVGGVSQLNGFLADLVIYDRYVHTHEMPTI